MNNSKKIKINNNCDVYSYSLFNKDNYYFLNDNIDIYNCCLNKINTITNNNYKVITNGKKCNEYYAIKECDNKNIYILDKYFNEIDIIKLKVENKYIGNINSIYLDCNKCKIIVSIGIKVYSITLDGYFIKDELSNLTYNEIINRKIINSNKCCNKKIISNPNITSIICFCNKLYIAYIKNNSSYISEISKSGNVVNTYFIDDDIIINSIMNVKHNMQLLITKYNKFNYLYIIDICCNKLYDKYCEINCDEECKIDIEICDREKCNVNGIIKSIALIECSLAHILNAEGEKIQKSVRCCNNLCELLKVNDSVTNTIKQITCLEDILKDKLEIALKCCDCKNKY